MDLWQRHEEQLLDDSAEQQKCHHSDDRQTLHRMKRHPELQPFVPSDRFTSLSTGQPSLSNINKSNQHGSRTLNNQNRASQKATLTTTTATATNDAFGQPKRYCSMTRLNQLAQPKMRPTTNAQNVASTATLSTNSSSRSISSINKAPKLKPINKTPKLKQQPKQQQQKQPQRKLSDRPAITPIVSVKPTIMNTPISPTAVITTNQTPQSSTPVVVRDAKTTPGSRPSITPAVQLPTPASSLEEELESAAKSHRNDITRDIVIEPSINEQMSEMSLNDPFYQSAASELVPESEKSNNGINYDRNAESLCRELQEDLLANGFISRIDHDEFKSPVSADREDSERRTSAATIVTSENLAQSETSQQISEDDDRRLRIEKELRDKAKQEDEDRRKRVEIVENILSRFSQGSIS